MFHASSVAGYLVDEGTGDARADLDVLLPVLKVQIHSDVAVERGEVAESVHTVQRLGEVIDRHLEFNSLGWVDNVLVFKGAETTVHDTVEGGGAVLIEVSSQTINDTVAHSLVVALWLWLVGGWVVNANAIFLVLIEVALLTVVIVAVLVALGLPSLLQLVLLSLVACAESVGLLGDSDSVGVGAVNDLLVSCQETIKVNTVLKRKNRLGV